ncbi:MAG: hypothetical protein IT391_13855 [Nitrospira sp.]|nr:hypothetical protein [Nitrospira sp.]
MKMALIEATGFVGSAMLQAVWAGGYCHASVMAQRAASSGCGAAPATWWLSSRCGRQRG